MRSADITEYDIVADTSDNNTSHIHSSSDTTLCGITVESEWTRSASAIQLDVLRDRIGAGEICDACSGQFLSDDVA
jgi:hypothetical protein